MAAPRKDDVKELILESAQRLLAQRGLADISLAEIAREAGISKGTLYYHYKNKNEIVLDLTDKYLDRQRADLLAWTENSEKDTSAHRLVKYVAERNLATAPMRLQLFNEAALGNAEVRGRLAARYAEFARMIAAKLSERTESPVSPEFLSWLVLLATDGLFIQNALCNPSLDVEQFVTQGSEYIRALE